MEKSISSRSSNDLVMTGEEVHGEILSKEERMILLTYRSKPRKVQRMVEDILGLNRE